MAEPAVTRLQPGDGSEDSTQRGCTSWLLISCVVLTVTTAFVFGWGLGAPNMYNDFTEPFLKGNDPCLAAKSESSGVETTLATTTAIIGENAAVPQANNDNPESTTITESTDGVVEKKSHEHNARHKPKNFDFSFELIKGIPQTVFLIGAFLGAITGSMWVGIFNRKRTVFANYIFCFVSSLCVLLAYYFTNTWLFYASRFILGYQGKCNYSFIKIIK